MDPDACLKEIREIKDEINSGKFQQPFAIADRGYRLAELIDSLDNWITRGGFLPKDWRRCS